MISFINKKFWKYAGTKTKRSICITFADGTTYRNADAEPVVHIIYKKKMGELRPLLFGGFGLAESYTRGDVDIEGDLVELVLLADDLDSGNRWSNPLSILRNRWHELWHNNSNIERAKANGRFHYNRGTEMFRQYLDPTMTYTCAYWKEGTQNLAEAQQNKITHTLKKLLLKPGETIVDIGGGWGSVLFEACAKYGVLGTNISVAPDQNAAMEKEVQRRGLTEKIVVKEADFREDTGLYDKYISLGVYEHAGKGQLDDWIRTMSNTLKPGGIGVLHFIGTIRANLEDTGFWIRENVFPGGYLPGLAETIETMDRHGLEILDIENLRRHYAKTLAAWGNNFDANWSKIKALDPERYNEAFRRTWRFYLHTCSGVFLKENNSIGLFQITFSKGKNHNYPMSREFLYAQQTTQPIAIPDLNFTKALSKV